MVGFSVILGTSSEKDLMIMRDKLKDGMILWVDLTKY